MLMICIKEFTLFNRYYGWDELKIFHVFVYYICWLLLNLSDIGIYVILINLQKDI